MSLKHMHDATLTVQGTALDSFRPRLYSPSTSPSSSPDLFTNDGTAAGSTTANVDGAELRRWRKWNFLRHACWLWRSPSPP